MLPKSKSEVEIGWSIDHPIANFVFPKPRSVFENRSPALSRRAVQACPAVNDFERDTFVIENAFDLRLRCIRRENSVDLHVVESGTKIDADIISDFVFLMEKDIWRNPDKPVIQIKIPYFFICDSPCLMTQTAPYMSSHTRSWPGVMIAGRIPIHLWPRILNWAFEWEDLDQDLVLKRGEPLCYLQFSVDDISAKIRLVDIEITPELAEFRKGISAVPKFVSNTPALLSVASERRPKKLVKRKKNGS